MSRGSRFIRLQRHALRHRPGRSVALVLAVLVAASGFTVLTASSDASRLEAAGTVNARSRLNYDVLVRPAGGTTTVERHDGLVQSGYLSGVGGGISPSQWDTVAHLPGVQVAAPLAVLGYVIPRVRLPISPGSLAPRDRASVVRLDVTWVYDNGLSQEHAVPDFAYITNGHLSLDGGTSRFSYREDTARGKPRIDPVEFVEHRGLTQESRPSVLFACSQDGSGDGSPVCVPTPSGVGPTVEFPFPMLLVAVDPATEAELTGMGEDLASGNGLASASLRDPSTTTGKVTPVLAASQPATELEARVRISQVGGGAVAKVRHGAGAPAMARLPQTASRTVSLSGTQAYQQLLTEFSKVTHHTDHGDARWDPNALSQRFVVSTPRFLQRNGRLVPDVVHNDIAENVKNRGFTDFAPAGVGDTAVRSAVSVEGPPGQGNNPTPATIKVIGTLRADATQGLHDLTSRILSGVAATDTVGADASTRRRLGQRPLAPSPDVAGLVQPPPLLITTLAASDQWYDNWSAADSARPISAIRVRVADVHGIDPASRERVRLVAQRIHQTTGLDVDITLGASATNVHISNPAGAYGRPALPLVQQWVKKGVAVAVIRALDQKSLMIFVLVLLVASITVANATLASVRSRRSEFGILASIGWTRGQIARMVLGEILILAGGAGLISIAASLLIGALAGTPISLARAALAVPAALLVALLAGAVPVWLAGQTSPMTAVRPAITGSRRASSVRSLVALGLAGLARNRARTAIGAAGLAIAIAAAAFLVVITVGFRGAVVGTVLGDAVSLQVRGADIAAVVAIVLLALIGIANVMYLNIRERAVEFATLRSLGWTMRDLNRVILAEALGMSMLGAAWGLVLGLGGALLILGSVPYAALAVAAVGCTLLSAVIASLSAGAASQVISTRPISAVLAEE